MVLCFCLKNSNRTFVRTSKPLNMSDCALFVFCFLVKKLYLLFLSILTCNWIRRTYHVAIYTLNTRSTPCSFFLAAENVPFIFDSIYLWFIWTTKHQQYYFSIFETSKFVRWYHVCSLFASKYVCSSVFRHFNL